MKSKFTTVKDSRVGGAGPLSLPELVLLPVKEIFFHMTCPMLVNGGNIHSIKTYLSLNVYFEIPLIGDKQDPSVQTA